MLLGSEFPGGRRAISGVCDQVPLTVGAVGLRTNLVVTTLLLQCIIQGLANLL